MINNTVFEEKSLLQRSDHLGIKSFPNVTLDGQIVQQFPHFHPHVRHVCYIFCPVNSIYIYIWNDNIQSFDCENNEASIPVFHADWTSVSVPQTSGLRGLDVSFIPPLQTVARPV